jgi:hypothetical protein
MALDSLPEADLHNRSAHIKMKQNRLMSHKDPLSRHNNLTFFVVLPIFFLTRISFFLLVSFFLFLSSGCGWYSVNIRDLQSATDSSKTGLNLSSKKFIGLNLRNKAPFQGASTMEI